MYILQEGDPGRFVGGENEFAFHSQRRSQTGSRTYVAFGKTGKIVHIVDHHFKIVGLGKQVLSIFQAQIGKLRIDVLQRFFIFIG